MIIKKLRYIGKLIKQAARLMIGIPDYDNYLEHVSEKHPERTPMNYEEFFKERQEAHYGRGGGRCC